MSASFPGFRRAAISTVVTVTGAVSLIAACFCGATLAVASEGCIAVRVPGPMELPDGSVYPAGTLSLCLSRPFSPESAVHRVTVGGIPVGLLLSRSGMSEGEATAEPTVMFRRTEGGRLRLVGYAFPSGARSRTYVLRDPAASSRANREERLARQQRAGAEGAAVLLAAQVE
jgi:hypothetical protein